MTERECRRMAVALVEFANGEATGAQRREVERHLRACDACRQALAALRTMADDDAAARDAAFFARQRDAIMGAIQPASRVVGGTRWRRWAPPLAASLAAMLLLSVLWKPAPPAMAPHVDALDGETLLELSDVTRGVNTEGALLAETSFDESQPVEELHDLGDDELVALDELVGNVGGGGGI